MQLLTLMLSRSFDASYLQETTFFLSKQVSQGHYTILVLWEIVQRLFHLNFWFAPKVFVSLGFEEIVDKKTTTGHWFDSISVWSWSQESIRLAEYNDWKQLAWSLNLKHVVSHHCTQTKQNGNMIICGFKLSYRCN